MSSSSSAYVLTYLGPREYENASITAGRSPCSFLYSRAASDGVTLGFLSTDCCTVYRGCCNKICIVGGSIGRDGLE